MIIWEQAPNGNIECIVNDCYGVVGLAHRRTGWTARLESPCGRHTAPVLFHTAREAKAWVERRIADQCAELRLQPAYRTNSAPAAQPKLFTRLAARPASAGCAPVVAWAKAFWPLARHALATYQRWNALYLDPRQYGRLPLCYATAQQLCADG